MEKITRRLFLRNAAAAGAVGTTVAVPAMAEPAMTPREQVIWYMREIERLIFEDGGLDAYVFVAGNYDEYVEGRRRDVRSMGIHCTGGLIDFDGMFAAKGGDA